MSRLSWPPNGPSPALLGLQPVLSLWLWFSELGGTVTEMLSERFVDMVNDFAGLLAYRFDIFVSVSGNYALLFYEIAAQFSKL